MIRHSRLTLFAIALVAILSATSCTLEATIRGRAFQGPYEGFKDQAEADQVALAAAWLRDGKPDAEIVESLKARGLSDQEARRVVALAFLSLPAPAGASK